MSYKNTDKFRTRISFQQYSTNKYGWQEWVFDQMNVTSGMIILELGCGLASLWKTNIDRVPDRVHIILSDSSQSMVEEAKANLGSNAGKFIYAVIDADDIPFPDNYFDVVITNHMLYHVPDISKTLSNVKRVLKADGTLYASTIGVNFMKEFKEMISKFEPGNKHSLSRPADIFGLENGEQQLAQFFNHVEKREYKDSYLLTEAKPLIDFALSTGLQYDDNKVTQFEHFLEKEMFSNSKSFTITKDSGIFIATNRE
jgi:ubiquinone/menaquinone biosynthesis C-methylase UbiE